MGLQVISWMRFYNEESIPVCQHDQNFRQTNSTQKLMNSLLNDEIDLEKCWKYFSNNYHFYCLPPNFNGTVGNYIFNMYNFQFSFNELRSMEKRIFAMKTKNSYTRHYGKKICIRSGGRLKYYYVTDIYGFVVLRASFNKLEVHYFDFSREYVQYIEIPFVFDYVSEFMIYKNTIMDCYPKWPKLSL